jgi:autotransporter-associated beta strand protein
MPGYFVALFWSLLFFLSFFSKAWAVDSVWEGTIDSNWGNSGNWDNSTVPQSAGDTATFPELSVTSKIINLDISPTLGSLAFTPSVTTYILSASPSGPILTFDTLSGSAGISTNTLNALQEIQVPCTFTADTTITVDSSSGVSGLKLSGLLDGTATLTKTGTGRLEIMRSSGGDNTYSGNLVIGEGSIAVQAVSDIVDVSLISFQISGGELFVSGSSSPFSMDINLLAEGIISNNSDESMNWAGNITGTEKLIHSGGTLFLSAINTYSGGTELRSGAIDIDDDDRLGSGTFTFAGESSLICSNLLDITLTFPFVLDAASTFEINESLVSLSGDVSGSQLLIKSGLGTLELSGAKTLTGGIRLNQGTLSITEADSLGASGALTFFGNSTLDFGGNFTVSNSHTFSLEAQATFNVDAVDVTLEGVIEGEGLLVKEGSGTLTLDATNTYTGGNAIQAGALRGDSESILGDVLDNGSLIFHQTAEGEYQGVINGSGSVTKTGSALLTFSGIHTYTGGTTIEAGTLKGNALALQGNITNNANIIFDEEILGFYSDTLAGSGQFFKTGPGFLGIEGTVSQVGANILEGILSINGFLFSPLIVESTGRLAGEGIITGDILVRGTLAPGNSIGTLQVVGDVVQESGSSLEAEFNATTSDLLDITGSYTIESGSSLIARLSCGYHNRRG